MAKKKKNDASQEAAKKVRAAIAGVASSTLVGVRAADLATALQLPPDSEEPESALCQLAKKTCRDFGADTLVHVSPDEVRSALGD